MPMFFFDVRDGEKVTIDEQGLAFDEIEDARDAALLGLEEMAKDVLPGAVRRRVAIEVRKDETKEPFLVVALLFEAAGRGTDPREAA
jgi:uncharacterized protein DUF6894